MFFPAVSWLVHWLAPLQDVLSGCRYLSLCVLSGVVSCSVKVSIHSFFPLSALFVTFKALQKCGHLSVGFLCICHMPVILGGTRGTCPSSEGCSQHVTGPPELGVLVVWQVLPQELWEIQKDIKLVASDPRAFTSLFGSQIWAT